MDQLRYIRIQDTNGIYGEKIPLAVRSNNVYMNTGEKLDDYLQQIVEGQNSLVLTLTSEFQGISTDQNGENGDFSNCVSRAILYYGQQNITKDTLVNWSIFIPDNIQAIWNGDEHIITVTNMEGDLGVIVIKVSYLGMEITKNFTIKKIRAGMSPISVEIESSAGNIFKNKVSTLLKCVVRRGGEDISDQVINYNWQKYDMNGNLDPTWNRNNSQTIYISPSDLYKKAIFKCEVSI